MADEPEQPKKGISFGLGNVGFGAGGFDAPSVQSQPRPEEIQPTRSARLVVLGPFRPPPAHTTRSHAGGASATFEAVTKHTLDEAVAKLAGSLVVEAPDPFDRRGENVRLDLALTSLGAFRPDALVDGCPVLHDLLAAVGVARDSALSEGERTRRLAELLPRPAWRASLTPQGARPPVAAISAAARVAPAPSALDDVLAGLDLGDENTAAPPSPAAASPAAAAIGAFVAATATSGGDAARPLLGALGELLGHVLASPELRAMEQAYRGVTVLLGQLSGQLTKAVRIDLVAVPYEAEAEESVTLAALTQALAEPADLVVIHETVQATAPSTARAAAYAALGERHHTPVVLDIDPAALGFRDARAMVTSQDRLRSVTAPGPVILRALAAKEETRWLLLAANRLVGREKLSATSARLPGVDVEDRGGTLFVPAAYGVAALALASFARWGHVAALASARIEGLPVYTDADSAQLPAEAASRASALEDAGLAGFAVLAAAPGHDTIALPHPRMAYRGPVGPSGTSAAAESVLADALLVSLVARGLTEIAAAIPEGTPEKAVREVVLLALGSVLPDGEPRPSLAVMLEGNEAVVTLRPRGFSGCLLEEISLGAPLAKDGG